MDRTKYAESFAERGDGQASETLRWLPPMYRALRLGWSNWSGSRSRGSRGSSSA
ncbi:hypothetical protein [Streptomyces sp. NPDC053720]|uniref:hypothetical protein n=1 Tax=Streptomyces sp. NPDC053720 TaxID=3154855 RepID=UPI0034255EA0